MTEQSPLLKGTGSQNSAKMSKGIELQKRKRVLVVGAGAAGQLLWQQCFGRELY